MICLAQGSSDGSQDLRGRGVCKHCLSVGKGQGRTTLCAVEWYGNAIRDGQERWHFSEVLLPLLSMYHGMLYFHVLPSQCFPFPFGHV